MTIALKNISNGNEWQARTNSAGIKETTPRYHTLAREIAGLDPIIEDSSGRSLSHINYRRTHLFGYQSLVFLVLVPGNSCNR